VSIPAVFWGPQNPAAHRLGTWEIPPGAPLLLHRQLSACGQLPKREVDAGLGVAVKSRSWPLDGWLVR
jgi:hypothetical protein